MAIKKEYIRPSIINVASSYPYATDVQELWKSTIVDPNKIWDKTSTEEGDESTYGSVYSEIVDGPQTGIGYQAFSNIYIGGFSKSKILVPKSKTLKIVEQLNTKWDPNWNAPEGAGYASSKLYYSPSGFVGSLLGYFLTGLSATVIPTATMAPPDLGVEATFVSSKKTVLLTLPLGTDLSQLALRLRQAYGGRYFIETRFYDIVIEVEYDDEVQPHIGEITLSSLKGYDDYKINSLDLDYSELSSPILHGDTEIKTFIPTDNHFKELHNIIHSQLLENDQELRDKYNELIEYYNFHLGSELDSKVFYSLTQVQEVLPGVPGADNYSGYTLLPYAKEFTTNKNYSLAIAFASGLYHSYYVRGESTQKINLPISFELILSAQVAYWNYASGWPVVTTAPAAYNDAWYQITEVAKNSITVQYQLAHTTAYSMTGVPLVFAFGIVSELLES